MKASSAGIIDGIILDKYGKFAEDKDKIEDVPVRSLPIEWSELPEGTASIAITMLDPDSVPVMGFTWVHWLAADIPPEEGGLPENASRERRDLVQGENSLSDEVADDLRRHYGGPRPPDKDHTYEITVFALDKKLGLRKGFRLSDFMKASWGHVLETAVMAGKYRSS